MVSIELLEMEDIAKQQANQYYDGNLSEYIRTLIKKDDNQKQIQNDNQKKYDNYILLQALSFTFVAVTLLLLPIYLLIHEYMLILLAIGVAGGCLLILQVFFMLITQKKSRMVRIWN